MRKEQLEPDIYVFVGEAYHANSTALMSGDEVLLIDGLASRQDAEELRSFIEDELKKQVRLILCTHYMSDHIAALKLFPKAQIIAHKIICTPLTRKNLSRKKREHLSFNRPSRFQMER